MSSTIESGSTCTPTSYSSIFHLLLLSSFNVSLCICPVRTRMVAVGNIKKITKAMKMVQHNTTRIYQHIHHNHQSAIAFPDTSSPMSSRFSRTLCVIFLSFLLSVLFSLFFSPNSQVASAKLRRSEEALTIARNFARPSEDLFPTTAPAKIDGQVVLDNGPPPNSHLVVAITPDRGLCGSVSATISRATRAQLNALSRTDKDVKLVSLGEKVRASYNERTLNNML